MPIGASTSIISPAFFFKTASPTGDSSEILPLSGSASVEPTIWISLVSSSSISLILIIEPTPTSSAQSE